MMRLLTYGKVLLLLVVCGTVLCEFLCRLEVKCTNCEQASVSREESVVNDNYIGSYVPVKSSLALKYHKGTIRLDTAWVEHAWFIDTKICLLAGRTAGKDFNIVLPFKRVGSSGFLFTLAYFHNGEVIDGGIEEDRKVVRRPTATMSDTLKFILFEKDPDTSVGWARGGVFSDTVFLVGTSSYAR
ncbi:MAG: hypothetical protein JNM41_09735 [Flavipsychrobacter sp.]|nr:hypothetical protein [Flavipsychrobacter sp.]